MTRGLWEALELCHIHRALHRSLPIPKLRHLRDRLKAGESLEPVARKQTTKVVLWLEVWHLQGAGRYAFGKVIIPVIVML
jgi:hypothetical protein